MLIKTDLERVYVRDSRIGRFREIVEHILTLLHLLAKLRQQLLGHMASLEFFIPHYNLKIAERLSSRGMLLAAQGS